MPSQEDMLFCAGFRFEQSEGLWISDRPQEFSYSDGDDVEDYVYRALSSCSDRSVHSPQLRDYIIDWPSLYHMSGTRANLLRPFGPWLKGKSVLEIGCGCGALTRYLAEIGADVLALEGSRRRARIAAVRCANLPNARIVHATSDITPALGRFDAVTLIGVLEYSRVYYGASGFERLLGQAASSITSDGRLLLAIENQIGLKYFSGAPEDHIGRSMFGINDSYSPTGIATVGKGDLEEVLRLSGFVDHQFFIPLPDYKLPVGIVFPEGWQIHARRLASFAAQCLVTDRQADYEPHFSRELATWLTWRNHTAANLADSFLVVAGKAHSSALPFDTAVAATYYTDSRKRGLDKSIRILVAANTSLAVSSGPLDSALSQTANAKAADKPMAEFVEGDSLWIELLRLVNRPDWNLGVVAEFASEFARHLAKVAGVESGDPPRGPVPGRFVDATPFNAIRTKDKSIALIDVDELAMHEPIPISFVIFRGLYQSFLRMQSLERPSGPVRKQLVQFCADILKRAGYSLSETDVREFVDIEARLQSEVYGIKHAAAVTSIMSQRVPRLRRASSAGANLRLYKRLKAVVLRLRRRSKLLA